MHMVTGLARVPQGLLLVLEVSQLVTRTECGEAFGGCRGLSAGSVGRDITAACQGQDGPPLGLSRISVNLMQVPHCKTSLWGHSHWLVAPLLIWGEEDSQAQRIMAWKWPFRSLAVLRELQANGPGECHRAPTPQLAHPPGWQEGGVGLSLGERWDDLEQWVWWALL